MPDFTTSKIVNVDRSIGDNNSTSSFSAEFDNFAGQYSGTFALNQDVEIYAGDGVTNGIIKYVKFNEGIGGSTIDVVTGSQYEVRSGVSWGDGAIGSALVFPGVSGAYVGMGSSTDYNCPEITVSCWFNPSTSAGSILHPFVFYQNPQASGVYSRGFWLGYDKRTTASVWWNVGNGSPAGFGINGGTAYTMTPGSWYHIVGTVRPGSMFCYANGSLIRTATSSLLLSGIAYSGTGQIVTVGTTTYSASYQAYGTIDDVRIYNRALSGSEVFSLYNGGAGTQEFKIFKGIVENIQYTAKELKEKVTLTGRDYGAILQDISVEPRIFKDKEASQIVLELVSQNVSDGLITTNNVNTTTTTIEKITFAHISLFDAIKKVAELSGFVFYLDENKDLHFEEKEAISSGLTLDSSNVWDARFETDDSEIFNRVTVYGDRQLTGARETQVTTGGGSVYNLTDKPTNVSVTISGATNTFMQPGGVLNIDDPGFEDIKYLVDYQGKQVILTSGTASGDNRQDDGTIVIIDYQRLTPIISYKENTVSQSVYGAKDKFIVDKNIKDPNEASIRAQQFVDDNSDPKINGRLSLKGVINATPGTTAIVNLPSMGQNNQAYNLLNVSYNFTPVNNFNGRIMSVSMNKKIFDFADIMKEQMLRLRALETSEVDTSVTNLEVGSGTLGITGSPFGFYRGLGSTFLFQTTNHNILNSPGCLLGPLDVGSTAITIAT